ncbi:MAG: hypothetical protein J5584_01245 [Clostridia bacterium]|nr:hypothetical protein [Clostridia bacterium]
MAKAANRVMAPHFWENRMICQPQLAKQRIVADALLLSISHNWQNDGLWLTHSFYPSATIN